MCSKIITSLPVGYQLAYLVCPRTDTDMCCCSVQSFSVDVVMFDKRWISIVIAEISCR